MPRIEEKIFSIGEEKPERELGEVLPSEETLFEAKKIFLFCEGKTEYYYFLDYKKDIRSSRVEIIPRYPDQEKREGPDVKKLTEQVHNSFEEFVVTDSGFKRSIEVFEIDEFCVIFDFDRNFDVINGGKTNYDRALEMKRSKRIEFFLSNYSFEVWILCHFKKPDRRMKTTGLKKEILRCSGWSRYQKGQKDVYRELKERIEVAKKNAAKLFEEKENKGIPIYSDDSNPVTQIGKLIEKIEDQII